MLSPVRQLLKAHSLRRTAIREQVLNVFLQRKEAVSQSDLEQALGHPDRITLYRTLRTFEEKGLVHRAIDGTDKLKFALCSSGCSHHKHQDQHAHGHCEHCGRTICMEGVWLPELQSVDGFQVKSTFLIVQGVCSDCGKRIATKK
ncbi:MAG: transcriptional repressor [Haliscomenobacter sp.]|nr:transcriptional repressor [Haliscomenobacter sp.]MBK8879271.1 transcriptional repressor [Haliscomenobacter sp.]